MMYCKYDAVALLPVFYRAMLC